MNDHRRTHDLLTLGNPCADIVLRAQRIPGWDDKALGRPVGVFAGGTESNVACAAAQLGLRTAVFGEVGDDAHADFLVWEFQRHGVSTTHLAHRPSSASAMTVILVSDSGERSVVYVPMPGSAASDRPDLQAALAGCRTVYTMPYDVDEFERVAEAAHALGTEVAIDVEREVARNPAHLRRLLQHCDIAFLNESGFTAGTGQAPSTEGLQALLATSGCRTLVLTLGARGAMAADARGAAFEPAYPATVVDTTGAGDSFNAAYLAARLRWSSLRQCLAFACAAASCTIGAMGARTALPTQAEVEAVMRQHAAAHKETP